MEHGTPSHADTTHHPCAGPATPTHRLDASPSAIAHAAAILRRGGLVAMPTETVYGLAAAAFHSAAIQRIFLAKGRPHWDPLIVHIAGHSMALTVAAHITETEKRLADAFWPGPLTLLLPRQPNLPPAVTAGRELVGVRMPAHPVALALIAATGQPLAAPSANRFGHVSPTSAAHVLADLDGRIDAVLDAGPCGIGVESTVIQCRPHEIVLYRAGGIPAEAIAQITGLPVRTYTAESSQTATPESLPSPGVGIRHYATRAPIVLVHSPADLAHRLQDPANHAAAVLLPTDWPLPSAIVLPAHSPTPTAAITLRRWAPIDDAPALAATLYAALRDLDAASPPLILVPLPQGSGGLFAALRDRLQKAARPPEPPPAM